MRRNRWISAAAVGLALVGGMTIVARRAFGEPASPPATTAIAGAAAPYVFTTIDSTSGGDVKMVGDIDGDGQLDLVVGGFIEETMRWYRYPTWDRMPIAIPLQEFTTDGELGDVDGDGDLDIVVGDGDRAENLVVLVNPLSETGGLDADSWERRSIGTLPGFIKDVELADFDGDGRLDVAARAQATAVILLNDGDGWTPVELSGLELGEEGMASGDVDGDADSDLVFQGMWTENPGGTAARSPEAWPAHQIGTASPAFKALVVDLDGDGAAEVVYSSSEHVDDVAFWSAPEGGPASGAWEPTVLIDDLEQAHTLQAGDMDGDGDVDVVVAQMHTSEAKNVYLIENLDGRFTEWEVHIIGSGGVHNGVVADVGGDGDLDLIGANWAGNPPVELWENQRDRVGGWRYVKVTDDHQQTFGLTFADVDGDSLLDIVSGGFWYRNPGGTVDQSSWDQRQLPEGMHGIATLDVDGDERADVIAQHDDDDIGLYWLEAPADAAGVWDTVAIGIVPRASHDLGAQGVAIAQLVPGERDELVVSSGSGIFGFEIPDAATNGDWPRIHVSDRPSDEGLAVIDVDSDGLLDVVATTGESLQVEWYRAPDWDVMPIGEFTSAVYPDRVGAADLNGDGRVDGVVTEENGLEEEAETIWWEQPVEPGGEWIEHQLVSQGTTNSLDVVDMDCDEDSDIVLAEHRGRRRLAVWHNDGAGTFEEAVVSSGPENHLGAKAVDMDDDGDLDIVGIAYDEFQLIHLWINDTSDCSDR